MSEYRDRIVAAMVVFLLVDSIAVGLRLYVRLKIRRAFGWDDAAIILTYLGLVITCSMGWTAMYYGYAASSVQPHHDADMLKKFYFANQLTLFLTSGVVKIAVALILYRIASTRTIRWLLIVSIIVVVVWTIVMTLFSSYICATGGTSNFASSRVCRDVGYFRTSSNIFIDYFYALLPIYILWKVEMSWKTKLSILFLLGLGVFASSATIVKLVVIIRLQTAKGKYADDLHYELLLWADIELGMALLAASSAALRPLFTKISVSWGTIRGPKNTTGNSGSTGHYLQMRGDNNELDHLERPHRHTSNPDGFIMPGHASSEHGSERTMLTKAGGRVSQPMEV